MNNALYDVKTRQPVTLPLEEIPKALADGTHSYMADARINVTKDGKSYNVSGGDVSNALQQGYQLETPQQTAVRQYLKENSGVSGTAKVALGQFADEALLGIPETIMQKTGDPFEVAKWEALKKEHSAANALGGAAGFGASLLTGEPLFKGAKLAGEAAERAVVGESAKAAETASTDYLANLFASQGIKRGSQSIAQEIVKKTLGAATRMGTEATILSAPTAITEAALGDPDQAAETLLAGVGGGMIFGGLATAGGALAKGASKAFSFGSERAGELSDKISSELADSQAVKENLGEELGSQYNVTSPTANEIKQSIGKKIGSSATGLVGLSHGPVGGLVGYKAGEYAGELASKVIPDEMIKSGILFTEQAMKKASEHLDSITGTLEGLAKRGFSAAATAGNAFSRFVNEDDSHKKRLDSFYNLQNNIDQLNSDPELMMNNATQLSGKIGESAPNVGQAYAQKQVQAVQYLASQMPRNPRPPNPWMTDPWAPSDKQLKSFHDKVEIVTNPFSAMQHLSQGTLTVDHMNALQNVYPNLLQQMQKRILMAAASHKLASMSAPVASKLDMFMQQGSDAQSFMTMQNDFNNQAPQGSPSQVNVPAPQTEVNRISAG